MSSEGPNIDQRTEFDQETPWRDEAVLRALYVERKRGINEIADILGCSNYTVHNWLDKFEIERRSSRHAAKVAAERQETEQRSEELDPERLATLYWTDGLSLRDLGEKFDVSYMRIYRAMKKHEIDRRDPTEALRDSDK